MNLQAGGGLVDVPEFEVDSLGVELSDAIASLRAALLRSWWDGRHGMLRFRLEPVELTMQVAVTRSGKGSAGIKWHVLSLGGEMAKESATTQTLVLRLAPILLDASGNPRPAGEQLISGEDEDSAEASSNQSPLGAPPVGEPE